MARYQVILAYDGTQFFGFQRQLQKSQDVRTVQGVFEAALAKLGWQEDAILAAGRTDTGVHASGQVVAFSLDWNHTPEALRSALNAYLPPDVAVQQVQPAAAGFHPRYDALARRYQYRIFCQEVRHPLRERYAWRVWPPVDMGLLQEAAALLVGTHDFAAFGTPPRTGGSTIRTIFRAGWQPDGACTVFDVVADAFLYHMVRRLVLLLVSIGQGAASPESIRERLLGGSQHMVQGLAPPHGLSLIEVLYEDRPG